jgi:phage terminase large subunit
VTTQSFDDENIFRKTSTQRDAVSKIVKSIASNFCLYGSSRSGKSFIIMYAIIVRASKCKSDHVIVRETLSSARLSIWNGTLPDVMRICFPGLRPTYNKSEYICRLPNGSTIMIAGLDDQRKVERLLGTEYSTIWFNEANQVSYPAVNKLKTRLAQKNELIKRSFFDLNPTKTSSWVYQLFEQKIDPQDGEYLDEPDDFDSYQMNVQGNMENIDEGYIKMLNRLPEAERKRFLEGEYDNTNQGAAVYAFSRDDHIDETAKKLNGTVYCASDFNIEYNSDLLLSRDANCIYVWDEVQICGDTYKKCDELIRKGARGAQVIADSTGKSRSTTGKSNFIIMEEAGFQMAKTRNPYVVDKIANLNRCFTLGMIKIHPKCKKLIRDLTQLEWRKEGELDQKTDPSLSHLVDCLGYACWKFHPLKKDYPGVRIKTS